MTDAFGIRGSIRQIIYLKILRFYAKESRKKPPNLQLLMQLFFFRSCGKYRLLMELKFIFGMLFPTCCRNYHFHISVSLHSRSVEIKIRLIILLLSLPILNVSMIGEQFTLMQNELSLDWSYEKLFISNNVNYRKRCVHLVAIGRFLQYSMIFCACKNETETSAEKINFTQLGMSTIISY